MDPIQILLSHDVSAKKNMSLTGTSFLLPRYKYFRVFDPAKIINDSLYNFSDCDSDYASFIQKMALKYDFKSHFLILYFTRN